MNRRLGPAKDLYVGENFFKHLIISHGGHYADQVTKETKLVIIGEQPGKLKVKKDWFLGIHLATYGSIQELLLGEISLADLLAQPTPAIAEYSQGYGPPLILCRPVEPGLDKTMSTATIRFSSTKQVKRKQPSDTPACPGANLVPGSKIIGARGVINLTNIKKGKESKFISVIHISMQVPSGNVKELVMDLLFMGLDFLRAEEKSVCFVHPTNSSQQAKKRQDMPRKFQKIHEDWTKFDQGITRFKKDIKEGRKQTYTLSIWLVSDKPLEKILKACTLEWEDKQSNMGTVRMVYKQIQSLYMARNLIQIRVPTDVYANALQVLMQGKMEEAQQKMVTQNPFKYGSLTKVPQFVIEKDFIKNTPYAERLNDNDIPFWAKMPFHLEYLTVDKEKIEQILAYMYRLKRFQGLFGDAAFHHRNPEVEATAGDQGILVGALMQHIPMVRSMSWVTLKGLCHPYRKHLIQRMDKDNPTEVEVEVSRSIRELMTEK